jgi:uncharacterized protein YbaR (Trm112 family)
MPLDPLLLEILACPEDKGPLLYFEDEDTLYNPRLRRRYHIRDGIPVMLIDEAETVGEDEHERLRARAKTEGIEPNFDPDVPVSGVAAKREATPPADGEPAE